MKNLVRLLVIAALFAVSSATAFAYTVRISNLTPDRLYVEIRTNNPNGMPLVRNGYVEPGQVSEAFGTNAGDCIMTVAIKTSKDAKTPLAVRNPAAPWCSPKPFTILKGTNGKYFLIHDQDL